VLVNDISEGTMHDWVPFWKVDLDKGFAALANGIHTHLITAQCAAPLMLKTKGGLIVEISDGEFANPRVSVEVENTAITAAAIEYGNSRVGDGHRILGRVADKYDNPRGGA